MSDTNLNALTSRMSNLKVSTGVTKKTVKAKNTRSIKQRIKNLKAELASAKQLLKSKTLKKKTSPKKRISELIRLYTSK